MNENTITHYLLLLFALAISVLVVKVIYNVVIERNEKLKANRRCIVHKKE